MNLGGLTPLHRLIICGSRSITDMRVLAEAMRVANIAVSEIDEIVSGGARGADSLGEEFARQTGKGLRLFPAKWEQYGKSAGYLRNAQMAEYADECLALWDGASRGTRHMICLMVRANKPCLVWHAPTSKIIVANDAESDPLGIDWDNALARREGPHVR